VVDAVVDSGVFVGAVVTVDALVVVVAVVVEEEVDFGVVDAPPDGVVLGGLSHSGCK
jgi:hypothetical protein